MTPTVWQRIRQRLTSPVVIAQIIMSAFALATAFTGENYETIAQTIVAAVTALFAVFAAFNNPTTPKNF